MINGREMVAFIRPAEPRDTAAIARLIVMAGGRLFEYVLRGLKRGLTLEALTEKLCRADGTDFCYRHFFVMEEEGRILAALNLIPGEDVARLGANLVDVLKREAGLGLVAQLRLLYRSLRLMKDRRSLRYPEHSMVITVGAVFPECQRKGIARRFMAFAAETARARGATSLCVVMTESVSTVLPMCQSMGYAQRDAVELRKHPNIPQTVQRLLVLPLEPNSSI